MRMIKIDLSKIPEEYHPWVKPIISTRGQSKGCLRASKPKVPARVKVNDPDAIFGHRYVFANDEDRIRGEAAYVWRMTTFLLCSTRPYCCWPVCADMDVEVEDYKARLRRCKELDRIVDAVVETLPKSQWRGVLRWGNALGHLGG